MTPDDFKQKFIETKLSAHELKFGSSGYNIRRGMAHSVAGWVEDAFALYVATTLKSKEDEYFVDKVISYKLDGMPKAKAFKPDVLRLTKTNERNLLQATHLFDLKTDLGFNRFFEDFIKEKMEFIKNIRGKRVWTSWNESAGYQKTDIQISSTIKYTIVVVIDWNIDKSALYDLVDLANATNEVNMFVLLNHYKDQDKNEIVVNMSEFAKLDSYILNQLP